MALSEIFDKGAPHQWANLRVNNVVADGAITIGSLRKIIVSTATTPVNSILPVTYLIIPVTSNNCCYYVSVTATGYTNGLAFGAVSTNSQAFSYVNGVLAFTSSNTLTLPYNGGGGRFGYPAGIQVVGSIITPSGLNILCQVINEILVPNLTDWVITTEIIGPVS